MATHTTTGQRIDVRKDQPFLVVGDEDLQRDEFVQGILRSVFGDDDPGLAWIRFECPGSTRSRKADDSPEAGSDETAGQLLGRILDELDTPPFLGRFPFKVVHLRNAGPFLVRYADAFIRYLKAPADYVVLIVETPAIDQRTRIAKAFGKYGTIKKFKRLYATAFGSNHVDADSNVGRWLHDRAAAKGVRLHPNAIVSLIELAGTDLRVLDGYLDKLALLRQQDDATPIQADDVADQVIGESGNFLFTLIDNTLIGNQTDAVTTMAELFTRGIMDQRGRRMIDKDGLVHMALATFHSRLDKIEAAVMAREAGAGMQQALKAAGVRGNSPMAAAMERMLSRWRIPALNAAFDAVFEAEFSIKSGNSRPRPAFERLVMRLTALAGMHSRARTAKVGRVPGALRR